MSGERAISAAKLISIVGFLVLVMVTYWLRSEVLALSRIHFSADQKRNELEQKRVRESFPDRQKQYELAMKNYEIQQAHYQKMMDLYQKDLEQYASLTKDNLQPPTMPGRPSLPNEPEVEDQFRAIQSEFQNRR